MKYFFITLTALIFTSTLFAQQYRSFPMSDAYWIYVWDNGQSSSPQNYPRYRYLQYMFDGKDTVIKGHTYKTIVQREYADSSLNPGLPTHTNKIANLPDTQVLAIREDNKKIMAYILPGADIWHTDTAEIVLYDFNFNIGDTLKTIFALQLQNFVFIGSDSVLVGNIYHKVWRTNSPRYIIEGIGTGNGLYSMLTGQNTVYLSCFNRDGYGTYSPASTSCFYIHKMGTLTDIASAGDKDKNISVSPNPFSNEIKINAGMPVELKIYNSLGQVVLKDKLQSNKNINTSSLPGGTYLVELVNRDMNFRQTEKLVK